MSIREIKETMLITAQDSVTFQLALNTALNDLDAKGKNVADVRYTMGCHDGGVAEYTALILVGG